MSLAEHRHTIHVADPVPLGEVILAPASLTGRSETQSAEAMAESGTESYAETVEEDHPTSTAETLKHLRALMRR